jgi:uncharacterized protein YciI
MSKSLQELLTFGPTPARKAPRRRTLSDSEKAYRAESRKAAKRVREEQPDYDRDAYTRGWKAHSLDAGDARGEPDEWYDGYMDQACGRDKWHRPLCEHHHNGEGGCGWA